MAKTTPLRWWDLGRYETECREFDLIGVVEQWWEGPVFWTKTEGGCQYGIDSRFVPKGWIF